MAVEQITAYHVLGLLPGASCDRVRKAYHSLSLCLHPDKSASATATADFQQLQAAYEVLKDVRSPASKRHFEETEPEAQSEPSPSSEGGCAGCDDNSDPEEECAYEEKNRYGRRQRWKGHHYGWTRGRAWCESVSGLSMEFSEDDGEDEEDEWWSESSEVPQTGGCAPEAPTPTTAPQTAAERVKAAARAEAAQAKAAAQAKIAAEHIAALRNAAAAARAAQVLAAAEAAVAQGKAAALARAAAAVELAEREAAATARAAAEAAEAARRQAPLLDLRRRVQEQAQRVVAGRAAETAASKAVKVAHADLLKSFAQSVVALEQLSELAVTERVSRLRHHAEAAAVWARHLPLAEREEKRLKAFLEKTLRFSEAGRSISKGEEKLNSIAAGKALERHAAVAQEAAAPEQVAALAQERQENIARSAAGLVSRAAEDVQAYREAQTQACSTARIHVEALEQLLKLQRATAEARIKLLSEPGTGSASVAHQPGQVPVEQARRKRCRAHQALKELRDSSTSRSAQRARQAAAAVQQLEECNTDILRLYHRMLSNGLL